MRTLRGLTTSVITLTVASVCLGASTVAETARGFSQGDPRCHGERVTVLGTPGRDVYGHRDIDRNDVVALRGGRDLIADRLERGVIVCAGGGNDVVQIGYYENGKILVDGGDGDDVLGERDESNAGLADLRLLGEAGDDSLYGGHREDLLFGGPGTDSARGYNGDDVLKGGADDDSLSGRAGDDRMFGGPGEDALDGDDLNQDDPPGLDFADGGPDFDTCQAETKVACEA